MSVRFLVDFRRPMVGGGTLAVLSALYFSLVSNAAFWAAFRATEAGQSAGAWTLGLGMAVAITALHAGLLLLVVNRWTRNFVLPLVFLVTAAAAFFMERYHVYIDKDMVANVLVTEPKEAGELLTPDLLFALLVYGLLPSMLVWWSKPPERSVGRGVAMHLLGSGAALVLALGAIGLVYQPLSSLMRNETSLRHLITPGNWIVSLARAVRDDGTHGPRQPIATDARIERPAGARPRLVVVVVGETVNAAHWGLNGYARQTTPRLAALDGVNYPDVEACGTNTEVSLPCMFSSQGLHDYDRDAIRGSESLMHLLDHLGVHTLWRDNQTGCKGACEGLPFESFLDAQVPAYCTGGRCFDGVLLHELDAAVARMPGDAVVVLHMLGNHGPSYYARYPEAFKRFTPACEVDELGDCERDAIVNAYDNAILYTDSVVADAVGWLEQQSAARDTALVYLSDHGESLGESGLYLHGVPRMVAPDEQLKVPMWLWLSPALREADGIDLACVRGAADAPRTHDALFSTVLGLMRVETAVRDPGFDLLAGCRRD
ncbi:phosphoethanolamine--lipid A transferase [Silanimonas sp.]|uniref:phosphoethanolamine transferase n=1 Tax=Silanimonas sp. TaxID=1929290 RepID=UPI0022C2663B|nr:phosphoethanolamine--lipid A transferase [Silanimonas sp.]MCZ8115618.1 phosphoethanolamine--lipid A transferase [Silanimonas sp.]